MTTGRSYGRLPVYAIISLLSILGCVTATQTGIAEPVKPLTHSAPFVVVQDQSYPYYTVDASPSSLIVMSGSTVSATVIATSLNGFSAVRPCGSLWGGGLNLVAEVAPSTLGLTVSVDPSCITLNAGETSFATLVVATGALTRLGNYLVTVTASFQTSPSGWVTWRTITVSLTVVQDVYLVPAMVTVMAWTAVATGGAAIILIRKKTGYGRNQSEC